MSFSPYKMIDIITMIAAVLVLIPIYSESIIKSKLATNIVHKLLLRKLKGNSLILLINSGDLDVEFKFLITDTSIEALNTQKELGLIEYTEIEVIDLNYIYHIEHKPSPSKRFSRVNVNLELLKCKFDISRGEISMEDILDCRNVNIWSITKRYSKDGIIAWNEFYIY